ncbi:FAD-binding protein [candidate division KSB1 bacterium]|nr:FAD-binding protein [candidate division KSB1 bacterium]
MNVDFIAELQQQIGEKFVYLTPEKIDQYNFDGTDRPSNPYAIVEPETTAQVSTLMKLASKYKVPVIPRGTGTGLTGGALALNGGVVLSLLKLNKILSIDPVNMIATVQPGVITQELHKILEEKGLYYPPDPSSYDASCIGGNIAEDAGGPHCYKYGTTRDYILEMEVVLASGEIIRTGVKTRKGVVGYDIHDLIIGCEGTLGIVTEITIRLIPYPQKITTLLAFFPGIEDVVNMMAGLSKIRVVPATMEFLDAECLKLLKGRIQFTIPQDTNVLTIIELEGDNEHVDAQIEPIGEVCFENNGVDLFIADTSQKRNSIWTVRRQFREIIKETVKYKRAEDIVVPISRIPEFIQKSNAIAEKYNFVNYNYGHLGDGNIHCNMTSLEKTAETLERGTRAFTEIFHLTLALGGTISGEHGIGITKLPFVSLELSSESTRLQKEIKKIFDPLNILNPGKIFE